MYAERRRRLSPPSAGIVRNERDKTIKTPTYGKEPSPPRPPPVQCCPEDAAEPPPGEWKPTIASLADDWRQYTKYADTDAPEKLIGHAVLSKTS